MRATFNPQNLAVSINSQSVGATTGTPVAREFIERPAYEGDYEATPSNVEQIFSTQYLRMTDNFVVHPIPSNYGLITYNGSVITVS